MHAVIPSIVAAAGLSTRMGSSKALLEARGRSFLGHVLSALREGGSRPILVVLRDGDGEEAREVRALGGEVVLNSDPSPGPISSLQAGLQALPSGVPGTLFTPVDHPLFSPATVEALVHAFLDSLPPLCAPTWSGRSGHPVVFHRHLFPELLEKNLPEGARTVVHRNLDRRLLVPVDDPGILADIDTPEDLRHYFSTDLPPPPPMRP